MLLLLPEGVARAEGFSGFIVIAIIYAILTIVGKLKEAANRSQQPPKPVQRREPPGGHQPSSRLPVPPARRPSQPAARPLPDTQSEAQRLEKLLRGLAGLPDEGPMGRQSSTPLESAEEAEERQTLEVDREAVSLETEEPSRTRVDVDQDEGAEALVERRIQQAMARNRPLTQKDHQEFDQRLKTTAAKLPAAVSTARQRMRNAIIWREILGPPLALREYNDD